MDLARAPCRAPLTARKKGSGYENGADARIGKRARRAHRDDWGRVSSSALVQYEVHEEFCQNIR
jgi:hypothetical protein